MVEDSEDDAELLAIELERGGYQVNSRRVDAKIDMQTALQEPQPWDIVLADYSMPQFSAIAALEILKEQGLDLPFVIVSGKIGEDTAVAAMKAGAHDYLVKGKLSRLIPAVERELREAELRKEYHAAQERLRYLAYYDKLTDLPNRTLFCDHLRSELGRCQKNAAKENLNGTANRLTNILAVLLVSIDRFRRIKQSLGYLTSEQLLVSVARRLEQYVTDGDFNIVARVGDDEFAILVTNISDAEDILSKAEYLYRQLIQPFDIDNSTVCSTVSIGIALNQHQNQLIPERLLQSADTAMQYAKANFAKTSVLFNEKMQSRAVEQLRLENDLQKAIDQKQLYLNYQPIVSLDTGKVMCVEALVRWKHNLLGSIPPDKFIPICEETGQIIALGHWVLSEACCQLVDWHKSSTLSIPLTMSINLSRIQIYHPELIPQIDCLLESLDLPGKNLKLEITESTLMENTSAVTKVLEQLKERDIKLCLDDFGTGYSSLSYLRYLPVDTVKIDRSFIGPEINNTNYDIIKAIVNLAHSLGLDVIAEGIETEAQLEILRGLGCEFGQGYFFAYPLNSKDVLDVVQK